jgi:hypothetical protein
LPKPRFKSPKEHKAAEAEFHLLFGQAMANWAHLERFLGYWFVFLTKMPRLMALSIFYSARNFNGRADMLEEAIEFAHLPAATKSFIKLAVKKARCYNGFRNSIAHGQVLNYATLTTQDFLLVQGKYDPTVEIIAPIDDEQLKLAATNFNSLSGILSAALGQAHGEPAYSHVRLEECLERVRALPNLPGSAKSAQNPPKRKRQRPPSQA